MTIQTKHFIDLSDIVALRFACKYCEATLSLSLADDKLRMGENRPSQFLNSCPNCHRDWFDVNGATYAPILIRATVAVNHLKELLYGEAAAKLGVSFVLEIKADAVPGGQQK